jgi:hypothetical protein
MMAGILIWVDGVFFGLLIGGALGATRKKGERKYISKWHQKGRLLL